MFFLKKSRFNKIISLIVPFVSLTLVFLGGIFSSNTKLEEVAEYATEVVTKHTKNHKSCCITLEKTSDSGQLLDNATEFRNLYGVFKQQKITFGSAVNADKRHNIIINQGVSENLSIFYVGPVGTIPYNGHYKHYVYPIEMMFDDERNYDISNYVAYISQKHADSLLEEKGCVRNQDGEFNLSDYQSLVKTLLPISIDGESFDFVLQNIYYQSNYYYDGLNEVVGDFIMTSYELPKNLRNEQQNLYFMSEYTYQNKYFMKYLNEAYPSKKYSVKVNPYNIADGNIDENKLVSFYYSDLSKLDWLESVLFFISGTGIIISSICYIFAKKNICNSGKKRNYQILFFALLFLPYLFFLSLYKITNFVYLFSEVSCKANFAFIITAILALFAFSRFEERRDKKTYRRHLDEINI